MSLTAAFSLMKVADVAAVVLLVLALVGVARHGSVRRGVTSAAAGAAVAFAGTLVLVAHAGVVPLLIVLLAVAAGGTIGWWLGTGGPLSAAALTAAGQGLVGLAALLVALAVHVVDERSALPTVSRVVRGESGLGVLLGATAVAAATAAALRLAGTLRGAMALPQRHLVVLGLAVVAVALLAAVVVTGSTMLLLALAVVALGLGWVAVASLPDDDLPAAGSLVAACAGWAVAACGLALANDLVIAVGALVGSACAFLAKRACDDADRSLAALAGVAPTGR